MDAPEHYLLQEGRACYRPIGTVRFAEAAALITRAIAVAREQQADDVLVDTTGLTGFAPPGTVERYLAVTQWAHEARGRLRLAIVARRDMIDPQKFGVTVAANRGLVSDIFDTEADARAWLDAWRTRDRAWPLRVPQPDGRA
ncbi:MAG TPA: hypothetical protein VF796_12180 [Humisphaera sp.]